MDSVTKWVKASIKPSRADWKLRKCHHFTEVQPLKLPSGKIYHHRWWDVHNWFKTERFFTDYLRWLNVHINAIFDFDLQYWLWTEEFENGFFQSGSKMAISSYLHIQNDKSCF